MTIPKHSAPSAITAFNPRFNEALFKAKNALLRAVAEPEVQKA